MDDEKVRARIEELAGRYEQPEQVARYYYSNEEALGGIQSAVLEDQVVDHVLAQARISEEAVSYAEALRQDAPEEQEPDADKSAAPQGSEEALADKEQ